MQPYVSPVQTSADAPAATTVVIIGGGIVGLSAALVLAERGVPVVVLEKGRIVGEQSSRNLGWIRKTSRHGSDLPLAIESERLWGAMQERVGEDVGYRRAGILYVARSQAEMAAHKAWLASVEDYALDTTLLSPAQIDRLVPGGVGQWAGGIFTASDGRAEPSLAASAMARAASAKGAVIVEQCAVRTVSMRAGRVDAVITERGEIRCEAVILAGGLWSRRFLGNLGVSLPTLPAIASVIRTAPMEGPTEIAVGAPDFSFRKRQDGGYTITQRGALMMPMILDNLLIGCRYIPALRAQWRYVRPRLGRDFLTDLRLPRRWDADGPSPFERIRTMDPPVHQGLVAEALRNLRSAWPVFLKAQVEQTWAGMIDITPDSLPVISPVEQIPGLIVASGFSGHGFGTAPAAGQLAADLATGVSAVIDPTPYRLDRL